MHGAASRGTPPFFREYVPLGDRDRDRCRLRGPVASSGGAELLCLLDLGGGGASGVGNAVSRRSGDVSLVACARSGEQSKGSADGLPGVSGWEILEICPSGQRKSH